MKLAIGQARDLVFAAEVEVGVLRVADRPAAVALCKSLDRLALIQGNDACLLKLTALLSIAGASTPSNRAV